MNNNNENSNSYGYGIDFGTTNSITAVCAVSNDSMVVSPLKQNGKPHPSVVWLRADNSVIVGENAKRGINEFSEVSGNKIISSIKRHLGSNKNFHIFGRNYEANDIAAEIFTHLILDAENNHNQTVKEGVVTIPISFDGKARQELRQAAEKAGFYIKSFVHEPFAALVGYCYADNSTQRLENLEGKNILVFDWGGGTLDITVATIRNSLISELSTSGLSNIAGDDFDEILLNLTFRRSLESKQLSTSDCRIHSNAKDRFLKECEDAKIKLSTTEEETVIVPQAYKYQTQNHAVNEIIKKNEFESSIEIGVNDAVNQVKIALKKAGLSQRGIDIDLALLIGGTSNIPLIREKLFELFGHRLKDVLNANSIIAEGAAIIDSLGLHPVLSKSIGIQLADESYYEIFKEGMLAKGGAKISINMYCTDNRDGNARLIIKERNSKESNKNEQTLGILGIPVSNNLKRDFGERVTVNFSIDENLILNVSGKAATQDSNSSIKIHNLNFGLGTQ